MRLVCAHLFRPQAEAPAQVPLSAAEKTRQQEEAVIRRADTLVADGFPEQALQVLLVGIEDMPYSVDP